MTGAPRTSPMGETLDETAANVFIRYKFEIKVFITMTGVVEE